MSKRRWPNGLIGLLLMLSACASPQLAYALGVGPNGAAIDSYSGP